MLVRLRPLSRRLTITKHRISLAALPQAIARFVIHELFLETEALLCGLGISLRVLTHVALARLLTEPTGAQLAA
jgi:hypothetical protein